jgi:NUMOD3 motif
LSAVHMGKKRKPFTAEHLAALSAAHKGKKYGPQTAEHRAKIAAAHKGKTLSAAHVLKLKSAIRPPMPDFTKAKLVAANTGKTLSLEHRRKLSEANKGRVLSAEIRAAMGLRMKARIARDGHTMTAAVRRAGAAARAARAITKEMKALKQFIRYSFYRVNVTRPEDAIAPGEKFSNAERQVMLGYSLQELRSHIERQFVDGMTWENYGRRGWHIDHIVPIVKFLREGITDMRLIHALSNLRPLWAAENYAKQAKMA